MSVRHVYDRIKSVVRDRGETWIKLEDGTRIGLPAAAAGQTQHVAPRMKVLLDLEDWTTQGGVAHLYVYDRNNVVMACGMGTEGCSITSPVLS